MIAATGGPLEALTPADGLWLMARFFSEGFPDARLLNAWWGVVDRSGEENCGLGLMVCFDPELRDPILSLTLTFEIGPRSVFGDFPDEKMRWCSSPDDIPAFRSAIEAWAPFQAWGRSRSAGVSVDWQDLSVQPPEPPVQPGDRMTAEEWRRSEDAVAMLKALRAGWRNGEADLIQLIHRYLLACCRAIWGLLPMEESREGIEVAERYIESRASREEFGLAEYRAEGAAFFLEPSEYEPREEEPAEQEARLRYEADRSVCVAALVKGVEEAAPELLSRLARSGPDEVPMSTRQVLSDAAYFADSAMAYPDIRPRQSVIDRHKRFLSAPILREMAGDTFCPLPNDEGASGRV